MYNIFYLILGLIVATVIPLGLLKLATWYANRQTNKKEICVLCGETISYLKSTNINKRKHYIEGAGQLCKYCQMEIYK